MGVGKTLWDRCIVMVSYIKNSELLSWDWCHGRKAWGGDGHRKFTLLFNFARAFKVRRAKSERFGIRDRPRTLFLSLLFSTRSNKRKGNESTDILGAKLRSGAGGTFTIYTVYIVVDDIGVNIACWATIWMVHFRRYVYKSNFIPRNQPRKPTVGRNVLQ